MVLLDGVAVALRVWAPQTTVLSVAGRVYALACLAVATLYLHSRARACRTPADFPAGF